MTDRILWAARLMGDIIYKPVEVEAGTSAPMAIAFLMDALPERSIVVGLQILAIMEAPRPLEPVHIAPVIPLRRKPSEKG